MGAQHSCPGKTKSPSCRIVLWCLAWVVKPVNCELVVAKPCGGETSRDLRQGGRRREHGGAEEDPVHPDPSCDGLPALFQRNTRYEGDDRRYSEDGERLGGADPLVAGILVFAGSGGPLWNLLAAG